MKPQILLSPPVALLLFLALSCGLYQLGGRLSQAGDDQPGKRRPYACGEDFLPAETRLKYEAFFQLALVFTVLHLAALVISTLPRQRSASYLGLSYLLAIGFSIFVLAKRET